MGVSKDEEEDGSEEEEGRCWRGVIYLFVLVVVGGLMGFEFVHSGVAFGA